MHCTAVGKVILAHLPLNEIVDVIDKYGLPKHTEQTITDKDSFLRNWEK